MPITLRCARLMVVPITGPRSAAVGAPQWIGSAPKPPLCDVSRMWPAADLETVAGEGTAAPASVDMVAPLSLELARSLELASIATRCGVRRSSRVTSSYRTTNQMAM